MITRLCDHLNFFLEFLKFCYRNSACTCIRISQNTSSVGLVLRSVFLNLRSFCETAVTDLKNATERF